MNKQYYRIGEVADLLDLKSSVLRFWESEFRQLKPMKSPSGQRYYTPKHIELLKELKEMLYIEKYTIEGAKKRLKQHDSSSESQQADNIPIDTAEIKRELIGLLELLK